ncbi:MAG TPA: hypothetical protein VJ184_02165, partial [Chryseolinea sp.]|nr:hypothetical protein [Chryseolinea sp.]
MTTTNLGITITADAKQALAQLEAFKNQAKTILGQLSVNVMGKPGGATDGILKRTASERLDALRKEFQAVEKQIKETYRSIGTLQSAAPTGQAAQNIERYYNNILKLLAKQKDIALRISKTRVPGEDAAGFRAEAGAAIPQIIAKEELARGQQAKNSLEGLQYSLSKLTGKRYGDIAAMKLEESELKKLIAARRTYNQSIERGAFQAGFRPAQELLKKYQLGEQDIAVSPRKMDFDKYVNNLIKTEQLHHRLATGVKMTAAETQTLRINETAWANSKAFTNKELKKGVGLTNELIQKSAMSIKAGVGLPAGSGVEPWSLDRHRRLSAYQSAVAGGFIRPADITAMEKIKGFMADSAKYAHFQLRWFASATTIFAIAGSISAAARATMQFYQSLKDIQAITGESEAGIKLISNAAIEVAKKTPIAASQATTMGLKLIQA